MIDVQRKSIVAKRLKLCICGGTGAERPHDSTDTQGANVFEVTNTASLNQ